MVATSSVPKLREAVLVAKQTLATGRRRLRERHDQGTPGIQICNALADLFDSLVVGQYESALADLDPEAQRGLREDVSLVAHGGYGRRDIAPYSDADLMILYAPGAARRVRPLAERLTRDLFDVGLVVGHSVRTASQACQLARGDAIICTSLIEHRLVAGSRELYARFAQRFAGRTRRGWRSLVAAIERARSAERGQYGETVYLLEPNLKRTEGGLRDLQLLRWIGFARYGTQRFDNLQRLGVLSPDEHRRLLRAFEFLLRLRNEMHFAAGKPADVLTRRAQVRLAEWAGMHGEEGLLPVEQFMREYFRRTSDVSRTVSRFVGAARGVSRWRRLAAPLVSRRVEGDLRVGPNKISALPSGADRLRGSLEEILRLADLSNLYDKQIDHETRQIMREAAESLPDGVTPEAAERFMGILSFPGRLGNVLHTLHETGILVKVVPEFRRVRCLLQFNEYHKYTVDEHCIRAVEAATRLLNDQGPLGRAYRRIKTKDVLHLALLLHDVGKGLPQDHSEVGRQIAREAARRLRLATPAAESLEFLVHKHLRMSHLALRRDITDDRLIVDFAVEVGSPERLAMLYVLTAADITAVGPDVFNDWKADLLAELYYRTMHRLAGQGSDSVGRLGRRREQVREALTPDDDAAWFGRQIDMLPAGCLQSTPAEQVAEDLRGLRDLPPGDVFARGRYQPARGTVEYTIGTHEAITPGVFYKLTGALTGKGLRILSAEINTLADALVLDRFQVEDPDYSGPPPDERMEEVTAALIRSLKTPEGGKPSFRRTWSAVDERERSELSPLPTQVRTDNNTSDRFTIVDVFTVDRTGLLYTIARTLFELELSVAVAKIGTFLDQVVDVFYVTDESGRKIEDEARLHQLRGRLLAAISAFENDDEHTAS